MKVEGISAFCEIKEIKNNPESLIIAIMINENKDKFWGIIKNYELVRMFSGDASLFRQFPNTNPSTFPFILIQVDAVF